MTLTSDAKFDWFGKRYEEYGKFSLEHLKNLKIWTLRDFHPCMNLKFTEELCVVTMKDYGKFEEELICRFKIDKRNLTNLDSSTEKSQKFAL